MSVATSPWDDLLQGEEIAYLSTEPAREARLAPLPDDLHTRVREALAAQGIDELYTHQRAAWDAATRGEHVVVTTGTASGKTLAFNLPVLDAIAREPKQRALYLYPTKALAQDQLRSLSTFRLLRLRAAIYDGDTESERRWQIRKWANLILTNPDMLHVGVLPHHDRWGDVLSNLRYVIVDEAHVYRGVFGSHVANVLRRLRRLAAIYGAEPQFLLASATIANPGELVDRLLDAVVSVGFPGTVSSLRQQWGRAGRRGHGLAALVASEDALDQYFMREPQALLGRRVEAAILDHENHRVLDGHVRAAAFEAPLDDGDREILGNVALERAAELPELKRTDAGFVWAGRDYPAAGVPLRSTGPESFTVVERSTGDVLGLVEHERAYSTVHDGAIYMHLGEQYRVAALDLEAKAALVEPFSGDYYTQPKKELMTSIADERRNEWRLGLELGFGSVVVTEQVVAYQKKSIHDQAGLELVQLDLPQTEFETEAIWFVPEPWMTEDLDSQRRLLGSLHAAEHSLIAILPLWAMCDRWDIGGLSTNVHFQTGAPTIFVYDGHAGGVGITERGFEAFEGWVEDTARMLRGCPCLLGCPSCVQSPKCGNLNEPLDKAGALAVLERMLSP